MSSPKVSIVIVNYNAAEILQQCLDSIFTIKRKVDIEVIVVDNDSHDDSKKVINEFVGKFSIVSILNADNVGFAKANNQGFNVASGDFVLILNNDTILTDYCLDVLVDTFDNESIGAVGPRLLNQDGTLQLNGSVLSWKAQKQNSLKKVKFIIGAAIMMKKELLLEIGGFDENYFFYNEDLDLCREILNRKKRL